MTVKARMVASRSKTVGMQCCYHMVQRGGKATICRKADPDDALDAPCPREKMAKIRPGQPTCVWN